MFVSSRERLFLTSIVCLLSLHVLGELDLVGQGSGSGEIANSAVVSGDGVLEFGVAAGGAPRDTASPLITATHIQTIAATSTTSCSTLELHTAEAVLSSITPLPSASTNSEDSLDMLSAQIWETQIGEPSSPPLKPKNRPLATSGSFSWTQSNASFKLGLNTRVLGAPAATGKLGATGTTGVTAASGSAGTAGVTSNNATWSFSKSGMTIAPTLEPTTSQESVQTRSATHSDIPTIIASEPSGSTEQDVRSQTSATMVLSTELPQSSMYAAPSALSSSSSNTPVSFAGVGAKLSSMSGQSLSLAAFFLFFFAITV